MHVQKIFNNLVYKPLLHYYLRYNSFVRHDGFKVKVLSGVFHPGLFFSTYYLYDFINKLELNNKSLLELGSGSGLLSMLAQRKGAIVTAIDKDPKAVETTSMNFSTNFTTTQNVHIFVSDLFEKIPPQKFDVVIINPPYFFKAVENNQQLAWYCGENGEYFKALFKNLNDYVHKQSEVYMVLADNCEIERIKSLAKENDICFILVNQKKIKWEVNFIFKLKLSNFSA